jgi:hypothetical protein
MEVGVCRADHTIPLSLQQLAVMSLTSGGRSVGIVRSQTKVTGLVVIVRKRRKKKKTWLHGKQWEMLQHKTFEENIFGL